MQAGEAVVCVVERGASLEALATGGETFASQDGGKTWSQAPQGSLTKRDCPDTGASGGSQPRLSRPE